MQTFADAKADTTTATVADQKKEADLKASASHHTPLAQYRTVVDKFIVDFKTHIANMKTLRDPAVQNALGSMAGAIATLENAGKDSDAANPVPVPVPEPASKHQPTAAAHK